MSRPIVFIATKDRDFECAVLDAVMETRHGLRRACDIRDVWRVLTEETHHIALAIIDRDFHQHGLTLLHTLNGTDPDFPILAVARSNEAVVEAKRGCKLAIDYLVKPVTVSELRRKINELCSPASHRSPARRCNPLEPRIAPSA